MKRTIKLAAVCVAMGIAATGCQKENVNDVVGVVAPGYEVKTMTYIVDGVYHTETLRDHGAWLDFISRMLALSEEGHSVVFRCNDANTTVMPVKKTVTYSTTNVDEAKAWISQMLAEGYTVYVEYDEETGTYHCTAVIDD